MNLNKWLFISVFIFYIYTIGCSPASADDSIIEPQCTPSKAVSERSEYEENLERLVLEIAIEIEMERLRLEREADAKAVQ